MQAMSVEHQAAVMAALALQVGGEVLLYGFLGQPVLRLPLLAVRTTELHGGQLLVRDLNSIEDWIEWAWAVPADER